MFPLITNTIPENGSENIGLNQTIQIYFDEPLIISDYINDSINGENIRLVSTATGEPVPISIVMEEFATVLTVDPLVELNGLVTYSLQLSGLENPYGEEMFGTYELKFTTEAGSVSEYLPVPPGESDIFEVLMTSPRDNGILGSSKIKIKLSNSVDAAAGLSGIGLYDGSSDLTPDELAFLGENLITTDDIQATGDLLEIEVPSLAEGKQYTVVVDNIADASANLVFQYQFSFYAPFSSYFSEVAEVRAFSGIKLITGKMSDYDIAMYIADNSELAEFISTEAEYHDEIDWANPPIFVRKYVTEKTQYDILLGKIMEIGSGATSKQLEDLAITYGSSITDLLKLADRLKNSYLYWEAYLKGRKPTKASPGAFIRGERGDEMPEYKNRQFSDWEGTKTW